MSLLPDLLAKNKQWSKKIHEKDPNFFLRLSKLQKPKYLWIGCSDSRVPANELLGLLPGEVFVHRNIANLVINTDLNCMSVIEFAVKILKVEHIIVTGHYDCGGVKAVIENKLFGHLEGWLCPLKDFYVNNISKFPAGMSKEQRIDHFTELNVIEQAKNICHTSTVQEAWSEGQDLTIHAFIYSVSDGKLKDLYFNFNNTDIIE